jgi:flagellar M-ring protein FliF
MLALHPGRGLERAQVQGILNLVAASVPELSAKAIAIVDQNGALLSPPADAAGGAALDAQQLAWVREIEADYVRRVLDIVEPVVGRGNVRAQVAAEVDFSQSESSAETFKPNQDAKEAAVRTQTTSEASEAGARTAAGVPGTASNQPGAAAPAPAPTGPAGPSKRDASTSFELDRTVRVVRQASGTVKRVSAAVVVNHRKTVAGGKPSLSPLKEDELAQLAALVREAIGFSKERGDSLNVVNAAFSAEEAAPPAEVPLWKRPETIAAALDIGKHLLIAGLLVFLAAGVLRPLLRSLATPPPAAPLTEAAMRELSGPASTERIGAAQAIARQDPKIVANVVKSWVSRDG